MEDEYTENQSEMDQDQEKEQGISHEPYLNEGESRYEYPCETHTYNAHNIEHTVDVLTEQLQSKIEEKLSSGRITEDKIIRLESSSANGTEEMASNANEQVELETLFENSHSESPKNIAFTGASSWQDSGFKEFKDYLYYHCHIRNSEIPHTNNLVNSSGDFDRYTITQLETWVRKLYSENKISSYDEEQLFKYLNRMK